MPIEEKTFKDSESILLEDFLLSWPVEGANGKGKL
jgi:hypothetical protein